MIRAVIGDLGFKHTEFGWELRRAASRSKSQSSAKLVTFLISWRPSFEIVSVVGHGTTPYPSAVGCLCKNKRASIMGSSAGSGSSA